MAKAIVCINSVQQVDPVSGIVAINYTVSVVGPPHYSYGSNYEVNTGITVAQILLAWRSKVIAQAVERGVTLLLPDVLVFGAPS